LIIFVYFLIDANTVFVIKNSAKIWNGRYTIFCVILYIFVLLSTNY